MKWVFVILVLIINLNAQIGKIELTENAIAIDWNKEDEKPDFYLDVGNFLYHHSSLDAEVSTQARYLILWQYHHNEKTFFPIVFERFNGVPIEIKFIDLNNDGYAEIINHYVAGAHTHVWDIYQRNDPEDSLPHPISKIGTVGSDASSIEVLNALEATKYSRIRAKHRGDAGKEYYTLFKYFPDEKRYRELNKDDLFNPPPPIIY